MTRFGIDALTAIRIARESVTVPGQHKLVAPNRLPSDAMSVLYHAVREGNATAAEARRILDGITTMGIRLLGDRVSRATAWRVAEKLGWDDTTRAEYVAVAQLQADAFVTLDPELAAAADGVVPLADFDALSKSAP
jgi:predicted nucleic acid-binding protein